MAMELDLELGGLVNGATVAMKGRALLDVDRVELDVTTQAGSHHWDSVLGLLGFLDAALVLAVVEAGGLAPLDVAHLRRRTELRDEHGRELGHEVLSMAVRGTSCRGQYLGASTRLEHSERATRVEAVTPTVLLPAGLGSLLIASATGFDTDWGGTYRISALTTAELFTGDGQLAGPVEVRVEFGELAQGERLRMECEVEIRELRSVALPGRG